MNPLQNKIDFAIVFSVRNANPNGDPLGGNRPRTNVDGLGEVTDVCLKRKIRNRLQASGQEIFVQSAGNTTDNKESLAERYNDFVNGLPAAVSSNSGDTLREACKKWFDIRAFGQVFAFKNDKDKKKKKKDAGDEDNDLVDSVSRSVRGPVTIQSAFSKEQIVIESIQITKSVNGDPTKDGRKSSETMGSKHRVNKAVYVTYGSISPQLAQKTGFSQEDAETIKNAMLTIFEGDESSARPSGSMQLLSLVWWQHNCKSGQYSSAKVHNSLDVDNDGNVSFKEQLADLAPQLFSI